MESTPLNARLCIAATPTLVVSSDVMVILFHVTGGYVYVDAEGKPTGFEDVFTKIAAARAHYARMVRVVDGRSRLRIESILPQARQVFEKAPK